MLDPDLVTIIEDADGVQHTLPLGVAMQLLAAQQAAESSEYETDSEGSGEEDSVPGGSEDDGGV